MLDVIAATLGAAGTLIGRSQPADNHARGIENSDHPQSRQT